MELIGGIARNVRSSATGADALGLDLGGRDVRLEKVAEESLVQDGDELIVAGRQEAGVVVGYAYRNITQGYGCRASCKSDGFQSVLTLLFLVAASWAAFDAQSEIPLFLWTQRVFYFGLALLFAVFTIVHIISIVEKFLAAFRVNQAAIETVSGTARNVRHSKDNCTAYFDVDARHIELAMPRKIEITNDDEVVVAGQRAGGILAGMDYRNVTRGVIGRSWTVFGFISRLLLIGVMLASVIMVLWFGSEDAAIFIAFRRGLALVFTVGILVFALDRFSRWRVDLEAWRRVRASTH
jgi:hypothetical protein